MSEGGRFCPAYFVIYAASRQVIKMLKDKKVCLMYLMVCTNKLYYKILKNKKVCLIYSIFCIKNN